MTASLPSLSVELDILADDFAGRVDRQHIGADGVALKGLLRNEEYVVLLAEIDDQRHIHTRRQLMLRVWAPRHAGSRAPGGRVHDDIGEVRTPC